MVLPPGERKVITLNVGGVLFTTALSTLVKYPQSALAKIVQKRDLLDEQGRIFIDRDGRHFGIILGYLRSDQEQVLLPVNCQQLAELEAEVQHYQLEGLAKMVKERKKQYEDEGSLFDLQLLEVSEDGVKSKMSAALHGPLLVLRNVQQGIAKQSDASKAEDLSQSATMNTHKATTSLLGTDAMSIVKEALLVWSEMTLAWSEGQQSDAGSTTAKHFTKDGVVDPSGPDLPGFHVYYGVEGFMSWNHFLFGTLIEMNNLKQSFSPGPTADSVYWTFDISAVVKSSGKDIKLTGVDLFKVTGGKISYIKIYWGDVKAMTGLLSA